MDAKKPFNYLPVIYN